MCVEIKILILYLDHILTIKKNFCQNIKFIYFKKTLHDDLLNAKILIYRGSSVCFDAAHIKLYRCT